MQEETQILGAVHHGVTPGAAPPQRRLGAPVRGEESSRFGAWLPRQQPWWRLHRDGGINGVAALLDYEQAVG